MDNVTTEAPVSASADAPKRLIDLADFDTKTPAEDGMVVELEHPFKPGVLFLDQEGIPYSITIKGADADVVRTTSRKQLSAYLTKVRKNQDPDAAESEEEVIEKLAVATLAWHLPPVDGVRLPSPTPVLARRLYSDPRFPWIAEQLSKAQGNRARFLTKPSGS